ncbi:MAG: hypothetical protein Q4D58_07985 [Synergistaceae bacterium]|nr:hypothetical protein [Synergistaceae bacterium]
MKRLEKLAEEEIFNLTFCCSAKLSGNPGRKDVMDAIKDYRKIASIASYMAGVLEMTAVNPSDIEIPY